VRSKKGKGWRTFERLQVFLKEDVKSARDGVYSRESFSTGSIVMIRDVLDFSVSCLERAM
jgi:hypothetical protein